MLFFPLRMAVRVVSLVVTALVLYYVVTLVQVWLTSRHYDAHGAQAIVVMGAAQYDGVPSPDLRARLDQALLLYRQKDAPLVVVTGNKQPGDQFTEAEAGQRYLESKGVPASAILQAGGDDSWANLSDAAAELLPRHDTEVLVVTDPFHEDRSCAIATDVGLTPSPTPTRTSPITGAATVPYFLKEALGVALGRVIGYQHLHAFG